jgi:hypothetical protein
MPSLREIAVLRAMSLTRDGAIFRIDDSDKARCVRSGWLTEDGDLTAGGRRLLLEETSGED